MKNVSKRQQTPFLPAEVLWLLGESFFGYLGTSSIDGMPHATPLIFVFEKDSIYLLTSKKAKKLQNLRENRNTAFLVDIRDPFNIQNNRAVMVTGKVKVYSILDSLLHLRLLWKIRKLFNAKYPKYIKVYGTEKDKIPKDWRTTLIIHRLLMRLRIENFVYMREMRIVQL